MAMQTFATDTRTAAAAPWPGTATTKPAAGRSPARPRPGQQQEPQLGGHAPPDPAAGTRPAAPPNRDRARTVDGRGVAGPRRPR